MLLLMYVIPKVLDTTRALMYQLWNESSAVQVTPEQLCQVKQQKSWPIALARRHIRLWEKVLRTNYLMAAANYCRTAASFGLFLC